MEEQEAVETPAEQTVETESAPVEAPSEQTAEIPEQSSADTSVEPEKVSKSVPYDRFKEVNDELKEIKRMLQPQPAQPQYEEVPELDPDAARAVEQKANVIYERREAAKFEAKHAKDLQSKLVRAAYMVEVQEDMAKGQYVDREAALERAKAAIEGVAKPQLEQAKKEGVKQGQDIAQMKQQMTAVGESGKAPEADPENMTADQLAKYYNLPRTF